MRKVTIKIEKKGNLRDNTQMAVDYMFYDNPGIFDEPDEHFDAENRWLCRTLEKMVLSFARISYVERQLRKGDIMYQVQRKNGTTHSFIIKKWLREI